MPPGGSWAFLVPVAVFSTYEHVLPVQLQPMSPTAESAVIAGATDLNVAVFGMSLIVNVIGAFAPAYSAPMFVM